MYIPSATTTLGTISGLRISATTAARPGKRPRTSPKAASVPSTVASSMDSAPTAMLVTAALVHFSSAKNLVYQARPKPGGGKESTVADVNEMTNTTTVGATRNSPTSPTNDA